MCGTDGISLTRAKSKTAKVGQVSKSKWVGSLVCMVLLLACRSSLQLPRHPMQVGCEATPNLLSSAPAEFQELFEATHPDRRACLPSAVLVATGEQVYAVGPAFGDGVAHGSSHSDRAFAFDGSLCWQSRATLNCVRVCGDATCTLSGPTALVFHFSFPIEPSGLFTTQVERFGREHSLMCASARERAWCVQLQPSVGFVSRGPNDEQWRAEPYDVSGGACPSESRGCAERPFWVE